MPTIVLFTLLVAAVAIVVLLILRLRKLDAQHQTLVQNHAAVQDRFRDVIDVETERQRVLGEIETLRTQMETEGIRIRIEQKQALKNTEDQRQERERELQTLTSDTKKLRDEFNSLDEEANLQSFGFYKPRYDFATSESYQSRLDKIREHQKR